MTEMTHQTRALKKVHGNTEITRDISIVADGTDQFVVQVLDTFCRTDDPRGRCKEEKQCHRTSKRGPGMSVGDAIALSEAEFARSIEAEQFKPYERLSETLFTLTA